MKIYEFIDAHPNDHIRVIKYTPAPDVIDEHGDLACGGEGTSEVMYDSATSPDIPFDLMLKDIITAHDGDDGAAELEYLPDECYDIF